jgi:hypothetical protein
MPRGLIGFLSERPAAFGFMLLLICLLLVAIGFVLWPQRGVLRNAAGFADAAAVLNAYDGNAMYPPPSDYASTEFTLDLLISTAVLRPPFLRGAKLDPSGILVEDPTNAQVKITLPMIKLRLQQGSNANDPMVATLLSLGGSGVDDQADFGVADPHHHGSALRLHRLRRLRGHRLSHRDARSVRRIDPAGHAGAVRLRRQLDGSIWRC